MIINNKRMFMINLKKYSITLLLVFFVYSCNYSTTEVDKIKIDPRDAFEEILLSEIAESIHYIKLQTDPETRLGRIHSFIIREKHIYVLDISHHTIWVFDREGNLASKLARRGNGPGEYLRLGPVIIDKNEEFLRMITYTSRGFSILTFENFTFNLLHESPLPPISSNHAAYKDDFIYLATQQIENVIDGKVINDEIIIIKDGLVDKTLFKKSIKTNGSSFSPNGSFSENENGDLFVTILYNNTFYKLDKQQALPVLTIDFSEKAIDNSIGLKAFDEQMKYLRNVSNLAAFPALRAFGSDIVFVSYLYIQNGDLFDNSNNRHLILRRKDNTLFHAARIINDITSFPKYIFNELHYRGFGYDHYTQCLVDVVLPWDYYTSDYDTSDLGLHGITMESNPILVLIKPK
jgi:hypothetical protein